MVAAAMTRMTPGITAATGSTPVGAMASIGQPTNSSSRALAHQKPKGFLESAADAVTGGVMGVFHGVDSMICLLFMGDGAVNIVGLGGLWAGNNALGKVTNREHFAEPRRRLRAISDFTNGRTDDGLKRIHQFSERQVGKLGNLFGMETQAKNSFNKATSKTSSAVVNAFKKVGLGNQLHNMKSTSLFMSMWRASLPFSTIVRAAEVKSTVQGSVDSVVEMCRDMTGNPNMSSFDVMFGSNVPQVIKAARSQAFAEGGIEAVFSAIGVGAEAGMAFGSKNMHGAKVMGLMVLTGASHMVAPHIKYLFGYGEAYAPLYSAIKEAQGMGEQVPPQAYLQLIAAASETVAKTGGDQNLLAQRMATEYAKEQATPAQIMQDIESKRFDEKALALKAEMDKEAAATKAILFFQIVISNTPIFKERYLRK